MKNNIVKYIDVLVIFLLFLIISIVLSVFTCQVNANNGFDSQEFLTWDYLSRTSQLVYKDYYYPYGIINVISKQSIFFSLLYILIIPVLMTSFFIYFKLLWKKNVLFYIPFITFVIFAFVVTGMQTFMRYGIVYSISLFYAYLFSLKPHMTRKMNFLLGIFNGIIFSIVYDQGLYAAIIYCFCVISIPLLTKSFTLLRKKEYYTYLCSSIILHILGFVISSSIFFIYLIQSNSIQGFLSNIIHLGDISLYAKTPYLHSLRNPDGIYNLLFILISLVYIIKNIVLKKTKNEFQFIGTFILFFLILLLEQKSIIRSIDSQLTLVSLLLFNFIYYHIYQRSKLIGYNNYFLMIYYILFLFSSIFLFGLTKQYMQVQFAYAGFDSHVCYEKNFEYVSAHNKNYIKVIETLKRYSDFNGKTYSFPGDPFFYILLKQNPPYYSAIYQASPLYAQEELVQYIKKEKINYIIFNSKNLALQDSVPNYVRVADLHRYIFTHFSPIDNVGEFIILKKNMMENTIFNNNIIESDIGFKNYLQNIHLGSIPQSEGMYKLKYLNHPNAHKIFGKSSVINFNSFLKKNTISSKDSFLIIYFSDTNNNKNSSLIIHTKEGYSTKIEFRTCSDFPCIVNLSKIPLLYNPHIISSIEFKSNKLVEIDFYTIHDNIHLW